MFKNVFPDAFDKYERAFRAGNWVDDDPGPWLGGAIVYKVDGRLHTDKRDVGPAACIPCGYYEGGEMLFPQFQGKFT